MVRRAVFAAAAAWLLLGASGAVADSISPDTYEATLGVGESVTITKTVTISEGRPTSALVDVFFLVDTTGSMGPTINSVKANLSTILSSAAGLGDVQFGVGEYKDFTDATTFAIRQDITGNTTNIQTAINNLFASGGGDLPEANLYALAQTASGASWRDGSTRMVVWFGDAPSHVPSGGVTVASAIAALNAENVTVLGISVPSGPGLNASGDGVANQCTSLAAGTGGQCFNNVGPSEIVDVIDDAITSTFAEYEEVALAAVGNLPGVGVAIDPVSYTGDFDRSTERTFTFDVTFTGLEPGVHDFRIDALVDDGIVATERDRITVREDGTPVVPEPTAAAVFGLGIALVMMSRKGRSAA